MFNREERIDEFNLALPATTYIDAYTIDEFLTRMPITPHPLYPFCFFKPLCIGNAKLDFYLRKGATMMMGSFDEH